MRLVFLFGVIFLFISIPIFSQETLELTLDGCLSIAMDKNTDLRIAEKEWKKAKAGIGEAYAAILPSVDGHISFQKAWNIQTNTMPNFLKEMLKPVPGTLPQEIEDIFNSYTSVMPDFVEFSFGLENTLTYGATLSQPIFLGGAGIAGIRMAYASEKASKQNYESKKQILIYQVADAFYGCLIAKELVHVQEEALNQALSNYDVVKKRYQVGSASGFEKMRAEVEVANLKPAVISAKNNFQVALTGMRMLLGLEENQSIVLNGELQFVYDDCGTFELEELQNQAIENRPEVSIIQAQKKIASNGITLVRSQFMPKLFFSTDYSFLGMRNDYRFTQDELSKGFTSAVSLQIPLFHGFKNCRQYQKARLDYKITQDSEKQLIDGINAEVEIAFNKFQEAQEKYQAARESIDLAKEALRLANLTYEEGASTQLDVLSSQLALTQAKLNNASALYEYQMARYQIRKVTGVLTTIL